MHLCFSITAHGFGHAAITCAVINRVIAVDPTIKITLLTEVAEAYLRSRINGTFNLIKIAHDFGMIMASPIIVDVEKSAKKYLHLFNHWQQAIDAEKRVIKALDIDCLISNISPISLAAAQQLGIKTASVAPFNWAQIYQQYCLKLESIEFENAVEIHHKMSAVYQRVDFVYKPLPFVPDTKSNEIPVASINSRPSLSPKSLSIALGKQVKFIGLIALGGVPMALDLEDWPEQPGWHWLIDQTPPVSRNDMTQASDLSIPFLDLLAGSDVVLTKPGYGTYCEIASLAAGKKVRAISLAREDWPETVYLNAFLAQRVPFVEVRTDQLDRQSLSTILTDLFKQAYPAALACELGEEQLVTHLLAQLEHPLKYEEVELFHG